MWLVSSSDNSELDTGGDRARTIHKDNHNMFLYFYQTILKATILYYLLKVYVIM